jgi:uncharacterized protein YcgI (DUF1989 family)
VTTVNILDPAQSEIISDEVVAPRAPWSAVVKSGDILIIVDVGGNQSGDCLLYNAHDTDERYSVPDTIAWSGNIYVRTGTVLRSNEGNPLATVVANEIDRQDTIGGACGKESNTLRYGHHTASEHGCRENFLAEARRHPWHRQRHLRTRQAGGVPCGNGSPRPGLQLPADEQSVQRLQPHSVADDRDSGVTRRTA